MILILLPERRRGEGAVSRGAAYRRPPDAVRRSPVSHAESSEARKTATRAMSSGCPIEGHRRGYRQELECSRRRSGGELCQQEESARERSLAASAVVV